MEMKWSPEVLGGLFCDKKDERGLYYWLDAVKEKIKRSKLKPGDSMTTTYDIPDGN